MRVYFHVDTKLDRQLLFEIAKKVLWKAVNKIHNLSVRIVPVDTGRLRNSLHIKPSSPGSLRYTIGDGVEYGVFVEYGTYKMRAQPFLRPAVDKVTYEIIPQLWEQELK